MKICNQQKITYFGGFSIWAILVLAGFVLNTAAQSGDEKLIRWVLTQNTTAFANNDLATLDKIWANDEAVTVFENGHANYGWLDYRNNHLAQEMSERCSPAP